MIRQFKNFIYQNELFSISDSILLSVSGGIDSMVMTHLFELSEYDYAIAHCNFKLRGKESDEDALFVENFAKKNKVKFYTTYFDTKTFAKQHKISIQMAARQLRINWFESLLSEHGYKYYATAHHQDDQIETFIINLMRGTGISGLHGIIPRQERLIHPMLFAERKDIEKFASDNNILYRVDCSNLRSDYLRNKIRHRLIAVIKEICPEYNKVFSENIERFRQAEMIYLQKIKSITDHLIIHEGDQAKVSIIPLSKLEPIETFLNEILSPFGFNFADVKDILASLNKQSGKVFYSKSHRLYKDRDYLILEKNYDKKDGINEYLIQKNTIKISGPIKMEFIRYKKKLDFGFDNKKDEEYFDFSKLVYPLKLRKWNKGDYFYPLGMKHKKLISDFFIDLKLSIPEKEKIWLLTSMDQVVWIVGHRIDNRFKVTPETQEVLRINFKSTQV